MTAADHAGKRALVLAQEPDGPAARIEERLIQRGFDVVTHVVVPGDDPNVAAPFPDDIDDYDLIVPMGSVRSLTNKAEIAGWIDIELDLLATAHHSGQPILGICFGLQLIADALGGTVAKAPVTEIGWYTIIAMLFSVQKSRNAYISAKTWIDRAMGSFLGLIGARLIVEA